jgi:sortase A
MSSNNNQKDSENPAADLIRQRLEKIYAKEPDAKAEEAEVAELTERPSKHQRFMQELTSSGKSLAEIQTAWHNYYVGLPDEEKHEVWQEFYSQHDRSSHYAQSQTHPIAPPEPKPPAMHRPSRPVRGRTRTRSVGELRGQITRRATARGQIKAKHHLQSLMFGLGMGGFVLFVLLFSFFNERIIAPFITPSRHVSSTPIITDPNSTVAGPGDKIIIPKINVEIPVVYDEKSVDEAAVQKALENGVLHYPTTSKPGELGNAAFFGHSSNNIFNKGKYKFAFVLLKRLENGDLFYLTKDGTRYTYQVYDKKIVKPDEVSILSPTDKPAIATLITCDPPGTSINRLAVFGVQINPNPSGNKQSSVSSGEKAPRILPSNAPSLWQRLRDWLSN